MAKPKAKKAVARPAAEMDGVYLFKMVLYLLAGSMWLKITTHGGSSIPLPIGLAIGLFFAHKERLQSDRKIAYAILLVAMLVGYLVPNYGLYINF